MSTYYDKAQDFMDKMEKLRKGIEDTKGSIEAGKDADYLVFDVDLLTAEHDGFSNLGPSEIYFTGKKMK